ncbi:MAG TPA: isochorismatase family cysteine hydrolase [Gaiellaceae bacterium]|nr:isochorismatase family cysteine hydrolase [Gaiellaceae bacterium]
MAEVELERGDALIVVDVLNDFVHEDGDALLASFRERGAAMRETIEHARAAGIPVIYVNDDRDAWDGDVRRLVDDAVAGAGGDVIRHLVPQAGDRILVKHRYSAFDRTALDLLLSSLEVDRVVLVGAATEGCIVQTAIAAREQGLKATIVASACATTDAELEETSLRYAREVGGVRVNRG